MSQAVALDAYSETVLMKLNSMRKDGVLTDVVLRCGGKMFAVHRNHLSAASQYFFDMFNSGLLESKECNVDLPNMNPISLEIILDVLYTGKLALVKACDLPDLIINLHMMQLDRLFDHYRQEFISLISKDNFKVYWDTGEELHDDVILNAVYNIIEDIYQLPDFRTIDNRRLEKLLAYMKVKYACHDLLLKVILQASLFKEDCQASFDSMLTFIDFQKLSNDFLYTIDKNVVTKNSAAFHLQCHSVTLQRFQFVSNFSQYLLKIPLLFLFGHGEQGQAMIQRCHMGEWENIILEDTTIPNYAVVVIQKTSIKFLNISEVMGPIQLTCLEFDFQGHKIRQEIIKGESLIEMFNDKEVANRIKASGCTIEKLIKNSDTDSVDSQNSDTDSENSQNSDTDSENSQNSDTDSADRQSEDEEVFKLHKYYLILCGDDLFAIDQVEKEDGKMALEILESSNRLPVGPWNLRLSIDWTRITSKWFAYFLPPNFLVIRCFPGLSVYYDITGPNMYELKKDNNTLANVAALVKSDWNICCLTEDGSIYFQDMRESTSDWKFLIKCPFVLPNYNQIILNGKL